MKYERSDIAFTRASVWGLAVVVLLLCLPDRGRAADAGSVPNTGIVTQGQTGNNSIGWTSSQEAPAITLGNYTFQMWTDHGPVVLHPDGRVEIPKGVTYTHAARCFWNAVSAEGLHGPVFAHERCAR